MNQLKNALYLLVLILAIQNDKSSAATQPGLQANIRKRSYSASSSKNSASVNVEVIMTREFRRPYVIPVFGAPGKIPIYYPPQPILLNPGSPPANPVKSPQYLPPPRVNKTEPNLNDKFGMPDDRPVWGNRPVQRPSTAAPPPARPTRLPVDGAQAQDLPPLVHNANNNNNSPAPSSSSSSITNTNNNRPPAQSSAQDSAPKGPNNCVWAIVNCCSVSNSRVVESCFEQRGCPGPFWGKSPCDNDFARAALESAFNYYNSNN